MHMLTSARALLHRRSSRERTQRPSGRAHWRRYSQRPRRLHRDQLPNLEGGSRPNRARLACIRSVRLASASPSTRLACIWPVRHHRPRQARHARRTQRAAPRRRHDPRQRRRGRGAGRARRCRGYLDGGPRAAGARGAGAQDGAKLARTPPAARGSSRGCAERRAGRVRGRRGERITGCASCRACKWRPSLSRQRRRACGGGANPPFATTPFATPPFATTTLAAVAQ